MDSDKDRRHSYYRCLDGHLLLPEMDLIYKMMCLLVFQMYFTFPISTGFLFDVVADDHQCKGSAMLCPPMCQHRDSNGCITCKCGTGFDPSHPEHMPNLLDSQTAFQPQQSGGGQTGGCTTDWMKCACPTYIDPSSGCVVCSCAQQTTKKEVTTLSSYMTSAQSQTTTQQQIGQTSMQTTPIVNTFSTSSLSLQTLPYAVTQTATAANTPKLTVQSTIDSKMTVFDTKLPDVATTPQPSGGLSTSTRATITTMAAFQCPGVFNCTKDCYTGYKMDNNGCPLCECAPMPTDLP